MSSRAMRTTLLTVAVVAVVVFSAFPVYWMVVTAFKPDTEIFTNTPHWLPAHGTLDQFRVALTRGGMGRFFENSAIVAAATTVLSVLVAAGAAIVVSRFRFRGRTSLMIMVLVVQMVPLEALIIPLFILMRRGHLLNSLLGLTLAYITFALPFAIWMIKGFVDAVPVELEEAAMVDGASRGGAFRRVLLPLVMPGLVATGIFSFIEAWNEFILALTFMQDQGKYTLPIALNSFIGEYSTAWGPVMAASLLFTLPVLVFFLFVQRRLATGLTAGAVKG